MSSKPELTWMAEAKRHLGMNELKHAYVLSDWQKELNCAWLGVNPAWCGIYIAHCLKFAGVKYPKELYRAAAYRTCGTQLTRPCYGCVAIKSRAGGNHVAFVVGKLNDGRLVCLGGNQSNGVNYAVYKVSDFDTFTWLGRETKPAPHRYSLETVVLNSNLKLNVTES